MKTASAVGGNRVNRLFFFLFVKDTNSGELFLVDTGAQVSGIPPRANTITGKSVYTLRAANSTKIETYGQISLTPNIGLRRSFPWMFTVAQVKFRILGANFLAHYKLIVDMSNHTLIDQTTQLTLTGMISTYTSFKICASLPENNPLQHVLDKFPALTTPFTYTESVKYNTEKSVSQETYGKKKPKVTERDQKRREKG
ncbi:unnamed protein product [Acanthosepion pharaonis]|uniref:Peptidase A2 domain-containing protein n=1 Tax=Acanthosepion pharaonis TaxID=158019 RepID=A0A812B7I7_ACAPH|nr:unnamed protein product [Sepia pharaonis]